MAFTPFLNETEAQGGVACRQVSLRTESSSSRAVLLSVTVPCGLLHRTFHGDASGGRRAVGGAGPRRDGPSQRPLHSCPHRSTWLKPCCGKRAAVWQVFLLSASLNSFLVACVILVVILLTLELLIDIKLLQCE